MIAFQCPECGEALDAPESQALRRTQCPVCRETILIPREAAPVAIGDVFADGLLPWIGTGICATCLPGTPDFDDETESW